MNLDPTVSPWIGIFASTGVCLWMAAIGAPLARAVFGDRPRPVWPFYAPALGIVAVLLTTNLSAVTRAPSAIGLLVPALAGCRLARRPDPYPLPPRNPGVTGAPVRIHRRIRAGPIERRPTTPMSPGTTRWPCDWRVAPFHPSRRTGTQVSRPQLAQQGREYPPRFWLLTILADRLHGLFPGIHAALPLEASGQSRH